MVKLTEHSARIVAHVHRYGLTTKELLVGARLVVDERRAQPCLDELVAGKLLETAPLYAGANQALYYHLAPAGAEFVGTSEAACPLPHKSRVKCYAIAAFCCQSKTKRKKLTRPEFRNQFSGLWYAGQPTDYYTEQLPDGRVLLGWPRLDFGSRWENLLNYCQHFIDKRTSFRRTNKKYHAHVRAWRQLIDQQLFRFTILTSQPDKVKRIWEQIRLKELAGERVPPIRIFVVPGMFDLLFPKPVAASDNS